MTESRDETALGTARARFVDGLARKASELRGSMATLAADPAAEKPREEMRRRLHALYASAQVFRMELMAEHLREAIDRLDAARDFVRPLGRDDLDALSELALALPALGRGIKPGTPSTLPRAAPSSIPLGSSRSAQPRQRKSTLSGIIAQRRQRISVPPPPNLPRADSDAPFEAGAAEAAVTEAAVTEAEGVAPTTDETSFADLADPHEMPTTPGTIVGSFTASPVGRRSSRPAPLDTVLHVLVVEALDEVEAVREALGTEGFEVVGAADPEEALRLSRSGAPDVVVAARGLVSDPGLDFIARLRDDPLTDNVPVVLLLDHGTANDLVAVSEEGVDATLGKPVDSEDLKRTVRRVTATLPGSQRSLEAFGELTADELADRLAKEFRRGLADSAASGRDVKVPIGEGSEILAAAWAAIARVRAQVTEKSHGQVRFRDRPGRFGPSLIALSEDLPLGEAADVDLTGRRIVVADDDPAVAWFFSGVLREAGARVVETNDGREALEEARRRHPDVILSDILMPRMDGFRLCRTLAQEPVLGDVPVVLLSWKEDYLQRMRELEAGAHGYLKKEAPAAQILAKVSEVLRPRARLEAQLAAGGSVRGRLERVGIGALLRSVGAKRLDARVTIRDAWNLFEVDLRGGRLAEVTQTASDGSFTRGEAALPQLLGVTSGRFTVDDAEAPVRSRFEGSLAETLEDGALELGARLDAVHGPGLTLADELTLRPDVVQGILSVFPVALRELVERLAKGESPRSLVRGAEVDARSLEEVLVDLVRRGAVEGIRGPDGEDRVSVFRERRQAARGARTGGEDAPTPDYARGSPDTKKKDVTTEPDPFGVDRGEDTEPALRDAEARAPEERGVDEHSAEEAPTFPGLAVEQSEPAIVLSASSASLESAPPAPSDAVPRPAPVPPPHKPPAPLAEPDGLGIVGFVFVLLVSLILGFVGFRWAQSLRSSDTSDEVSDGSRHDPPEPPRTADLPEEIAPASIGSAVRDEADLSFSRVIPSVEDAEVTVPEGHGVLRLAGAETRGGLEVLLDGRPAAEGWPFERALPSGRHDLELRRGDETIFRFVTVRPGHTHLVPTP